MEVIRTPESRQELRDLRRALGVVEHFRALDPEMQAQTMATFLHVALKEGLSLRDLQDLTGTAASSCSRNVAALSKWHRKDKPGHDLVVAREDPMERRRKQVSLTVKGKHFVSRLLEVLRR